MDRSQLDTLARRYLSTRFDHTEEWLSAPVIPSTEADRDAVSFALEDEAEAATVALASGRYGSALDKARSLLPDGDPDTLAKLARRLLEADIEACRAEIRALSGEPLAYPSLAPTAAPAAPKEEPKETPRLSEVLAAFVEERSSQGKWTAKTRLERETAGAVIVELLCDPRVGEVTKDDMRTFGLTVPRVPTHVRKRYPGKSLAEVLAIVGDDPKVERLSPVSVNLYFQLTRSLFAWAVEHDKITNSPAVVLHDHDEGDAQTKRTVFADADIRRFLDYIGDVAGEPWLWWIPRILALSGMRLGEVAQLRKCDVREERGVQVFDVNGEDGKELKTAASVRLVPVHPRLVEIGLPAFIAAQPDGFLWPERLRVTADPRKGNFDRLSRLLNDRIRRAGITDRRKVVHSFRHTFRDRLSDAEVPTHVVKAIIGHTDTDITTGIYGSRPSPAKMLAAVEKVTLPV